MPFNLVRPGLPQTARPDQDDCERDETTNLRTRNEQVRGSIPRGGSTFLTWTNSPGQSLLWIGRVLTSLVVSPHMKSIVVRDRLLLRWGWLPSSRRRGTPWLNPVTRAVRCRPDAIVVTATPRSIRCMGRPACSLCQRSHSGNSALAAMVIGLSGIQSLINASWNSTRCGETACQVSGGCPPFIPVPAQRRPPDRVRYRAPHMPTGERLCHRIRIQAVIQRSRRRHVRFRSASARS